MTAVDDLPTAPLELSSAEACAAASITYRQLDHWARQGHLGEHRLPGSGHVRTWTEADADHLCLMAALVRSGFLPEAASRLACTLTDQTEADIDGPFRIVRTDRPTNSTRLTPAELAEDVEFLLDAGDHPTRIAARLDTTVGALEKRLRTNGHRALATRYARAIRQETPR